MEKFEHPIKNQENIDKKSDNIASIFEDGAKKEACLRKIEHLLTRDFPRIQEIKRINPEEFKKELIYFFHKQEEITRIIKERFDYEQVKNSNVGNCPEEYSTASILRMESRERIKAIQLYHLVSVLNGGLIGSKGDIKRELSEILQQKKILVIGDDIGSLSEVFNFFGAEAYGIESDDFYVAVAHSGLAGESGKPQTQVIRADVGDLQDKNKETFKYLEKIGPFDAIYSWAVFNFGSGIERNEYLGKDYFGDIKKKCNLLLKKGGFSLHDEVNIPEFFSDDDSEEVVPNREKVGYDKSFVFIPKQIK
jgi:hypothetical protein